MTTQANLYVDQGTDFAINVDVSINNEDITLSDKTFLCSFAKLYSSTASANASVTPLVGNNSILELSIDGSTTENLEPGKYVYDVLMTSPSGIKTKIIDGLITIIPTITRT